MRRPLVILAFLALAQASFVPASARSEEFFAGAAVRDITPDPLLPLSGGMGPAVPAKSKQGELEVRALVFKKGSDALAIVGVDLLGFPSALGRRVCDKVPRMKPECILLGASHTHSAPDCYAFPDGKGGHTADLRYLDFVCTQAAAAINDAFDRLEPARLRIATGEAKGRIAFNYYAPDLYDRRVGVIQAVRPAGGAIATLVNYAIHPEVLGAKSGVLSPDLVGPLRDRVAAKGGGVCVFMNGAQGGMITADNRDLSRLRDPERGYWDDRNSWDECVRIGNTLADESLRILGETPVQMDPLLHVASRDVRFPVDSDALWAVVQRSPLKYAHSPDRSIRARINFVQLGDARILTIPGEAMPNIGFYLKRKMGGKHNLLFGLTNDAFGYILTKVDFNSFPRYDYVSRVSLGEMTGEILIDESLKLVAAEAKPAVPTARTPR
jgi:hypothetical protein